MSLKPVDAVLYGRPLPDSPASASPQIARHLERLPVGSGGSGGVEIEAGYHAIPSLEPLHLHIISQDFESDCLKNKKVTRRL